MVVSVLGLFSAALTTAAWFPQIFHTWRTRSAEGVSWPYLCTMGSGLSAWLAYGVCKSDVALMSANGVSLTLVLLLMGLKLAGRGSALA